MKRIGKVCLALGCVLILGSMALLCFSQIRGRMARENAIEILQNIRSVLPPESAGTMESYACMDMPVLQIEDQDFCGIIDIPGFGVTLPIYNTWDTTKIRVFPCRFWGTVYDGSLIVGGSDQQGQFDFLDQIQHGCVVTVTDMTGAKFDYTVSWIQRSKDASAEILAEGEWDLTLFARSSTAMEYLIVRCMVSP